MAMTMDQKVLEYRVRRAAKRNGLRVEKTRERKHPPEGGYWVLDDRNNVLLGATRQAYDASLDDVDCFLKLHTVRWN